MSWTAIDENALAHDLENITEVFPEDVSSDVGEDVDYTSPPSPEKSPSIVIIPRKFPSPLRAYGMLLYTGIGAGLLASPYIVHTYGLAGGVLIFLVGGLITMTAQMVIVRLSIDGIDTLAMLKTSVFTRLLLVFYQLVVASTSFQIMYLFFAGIITYLFPHANNTLVRRLFAFLSIFTVFWMVMTVPKTKLRYLSKKMGAFSLACVLSGSILMLGHLYFNSDAYVTAERWNKIWQTKNIACTGLGVGFCVHGMTNYMSLQKLATRMPDPQQLYFIIPFATVTIVTIYSLVAVAGALLLQEMSTANIISAIPLNWASFLLVRILYMLNRTCNCVLAINSVKSNLPIQVRSFYTKLLRTLISCLIPLLLCLTPGPTVRMSVEFSGAIFINTLFVLTPAFMLLWNKHAAYSTVSFASFVIMLSVLIHVLYFASFIYSYL